MSGIQLVLWVCLIGVVVYGFVLAAQGQATSGQLVAFLLLPSAWPCRCPR